MNTDYPSRTERLHIEATIHYAEALLERTRSVGDRLAASLAFSEWETKWYNFWTCLVPRRFSRWIYNKLRSHVKMSDLEEYP